MSELFLTVLEAEIVSRARRMAERAEGAAKYAAVGALPCTSDHPCGFPVTVNVDVDNLRNHYERVLTIGAVRALLAQVEAEVGK